MWPNIFLPKLFLRSDSHEPTFFLGKGIKKQFVLSSDLSEILTATHCEWKVEWKRPVIKTCIFEISHHGLV